MEDKNILLCYDSNYNIQGQVTIYSLLENTNNKINFHIIHEDPDNYKNISPKIINHKNLDSLNFYKFIKREDVEFPNFDESHMTEATYYRLFLGDYLPESIKNIMYIDPDIICINNYDKIFQTTFENLNKSEFVISARTEHFEEGNSETSKRLELTKNKYFNAGVTFINYQRWVEKKFTENLTNHMNYLGERVMWFDQDVLNSYLNGKYTELPTELNFTDINLTISDVEREAIFYHYWGKKKPWTVKGFLFYGESFYQRVYRSIFEENYHIVHRYKKDSLKHFFIFVFTLKIFRLKSPIRFIKNFIFSFGE